MSWHILGGGSLGCLWTARLQLAGQAVQLILRPNALQQLQTLNSQLCFTDLGGTQHNLKVSAQTAQAQEPIERLIVATKSHAAAEAVSSVRQRLQVGSQVVLLQNGIGSQQAVAELVPHCRVLVASSTEGAWLKQPFNCVHAGSGLTQIGDLLPCSSPTPNWLYELQQAGIHCQWQADILPVLWRKLAINCLINPLTVIHQCRNGELAQFQSLLSALADELQQLLIAAGQAEAACDLLATALQVIHNTAANRSSMLQDALQGRRTEISHITGFALAQSQKLGLACPQLLALHQQLQQQLRQLGLPDY